MLSPGLSTNHLKTVAKTIAGCGTPDARNAIFPRGILCQVENFLTCNSVRRDMVRQYDALAQLITTALHHTAHQYSLPNQITIDYSGSRITFTFPEEDNSQACVAIEVSRRGKTSTTEVDGYRFRHICTALLIRHRCGLTFSSSPLTEEGKINLKEAVLCNVDLRGAFLAEADLESANLSGANLSDTNLSMANLHGANLSQANLYCANLFSANLQTANLVKANLQEARLRKANLFEASLQGANLHLADLQSANLQRANLHLANLSGAKLRDANLCEGEFVKTNLQKADMRGCFLRYVDLRGASLKDSVLDNISLPNSSTRLLQLPPPACWNNVVIDICLNHINNPATGSLLTMMDSIAEQYSDLKLHMAHELMDLLQNTDVSDAVPALLDVLYKAPWLADPGIASWMDEAGRGYLSRYNDHIMPMNQSGSGAIITLFSRCPDLMLTLNSVFIQLVDRVINTENEANRNRVLRLYDCYLGQKQVAPWTTLEIFGGDGSGKPDWANRDAANYILFSPRTDGQVMLLSQNTFHRMLKPDPCQPVCYHFHLYNRQMEALPPERESPGTLFSQHFPLFLRPYQYALKEAGFHKLLGLLNLAELHELFLSAIRQGSSQIKLNSREQRQRLREIFRPVLEHSIIPDSYSLKEAHYRRIVEAYNLAHVGDNLRAGTLLSLAALFIKFSSSTFFDTDNDSSDMLRSYASALMTKAYFLDKRVFNNQSVDLFKGWKNLLSRLNCSAILSSDMISHIRQFFPDTLAGIIPPGWS